MEPTKQVIPLFLIAAAIITIVLLTNKPNRETPQTVISVRTTKISSDAPREMLLVSGTTRSGDSAILRFQVAGRVTEKLVKLGDDVESGDVLARIYNPEVAPQAQQAADNLARLEAETKQAERDFQRLDALYKEQAVTLQEWENSRTELVAKNKSRAAAESALVQAKQISKELSLVAPFAGSLTEILLDVGDVVAVGSAAMRLTNPNSVELKLPLSDAVLNQLSIGQKVPVRETLAPQNTAIEGEIIELSPYREKGSLPEIIIRLDPESVRPGTAVTASIDISANVSMSIPLRSVLMTGDQTTAVYRVTDGVATLVPIRPIKISENSVLISRGLSAGDEIVTEGIPQLYDGARVSAINTQEVTP